MKMLYHLRPVMTMKFNLALGFHFGFVFHFCSPSPPPCNFPVGTGSAELLEIQRAAKFGNILWISSLALVLHSGTTSHLGYPSAFLYSWLCAGTKKVSHLSDDSDLDSVGIQVISPKCKYCLSLVVFFSKLTSFLDQKSTVFRLSDRKL